MKKAFTLTALLLTGFANFIWAQPITPVTGFGSNPGALNMYTYVPSGITGPAPLVIAMHGCTENATSYAQQSGWNKLANLYKFYVVYPEQVSANNSSLCFNWFDTTDINRGVGEALSVKQMVDYMKANYSINASAIYVTGLSAGAGMTTVMIATYPDVFTSAAIMSGLPYKAATSSTNAFTAMNGGVTMTPAQWGALVRAQNPGFKNPYPHVAIFQGLSDYTVNSANATEIMKQWTNLDHGDQTVDSVYNSFNGNTNVQLNIYNDSANNPIVYLYKITGMAHGIAVDTGSCPRQGGATNTYSIEEKNFHSTFWAADFFKLIPEPYVITGATNVAVSATGKTYSVPATTGSTYQWSVPPGCTITSGQGTNSITVNFSTHSGYVQVSETPKAGCELNPAKLFVTVGTTTGINTLENITGTIFYNSSDNSITLTNINAADVKSIRLVNILGQTITESGTTKENKVILSKKPAAGIYLIVVCDSQQQYVRKIAVQ